MQPKLSAGFLQQIRRTIARYEMVLPGDCVMVAVSGGPDSVALLAALATLAGEMRIKVRAAHLNHQLRGAESLRDQQCAEHVAKWLGVPYVAGSSESLHDGPNLEARAREERYAFLARVAREQSCTKVATGHTLDDQAETVLMRLLRGTGSDGLAGIHAVRDGWIIRPLIECLRAEVLAFLQAGELPFCEDRSNLDPRFLRNRIRHEVMPLLESINPSVKRNLAAAAQIMTEEVALLEHEAPRFVTEAPAADGSLAVAALVGAPPPLRARVVRTWLRAQRGDLQRLTATHFGAIVDLARGARPNGCVRLPGGQLVVREYDRLRFSRRDAAAVVEPEHLLEPGTEITLQSGWRIRSELRRLRGATWRRPADLMELVADAQALTAPLVVRTPRPGDRVQPLGLGGHRKLQDIFIDRKLPLAARRSCPVIECNGEVLWVPGVVRSSYALVTPETRAAVRLVARQTAIAGP